MSGERTFFEHQSLARRNTRVMVVLFVLAVIAVVLAVDLVLAAAWLWSSSDEFKRVAPGAPPTLAAAIKAVPVTVLLWGALGTLAVIASASLVKVAGLSAGGDAVARMAGARLVAPGSREANERRLLNVVEEMAIASGVRVPKVYVLDAETGINAFAAGYDVSNAVVAVTRGTLETLNRDELQGVIGHEFSHILNGDMRLNIHLLGTLAGIVFIGAIGAFIMRSVAGGRGRKDAGSGGLFVVGLALFIVGYTGLFFARLIKAAVSRQREFLADASSVQFTRNPEGLAGALDQIGRAAPGALIAGRYAEDLSHMFFGQGIKLGLAGLLDTHPPLAERIRRVLPAFEAVKYLSRRAPVAAPPHGAGDLSGGGPVPGAAGLAAAAAPEPATVQQGRRAIDLGTAWGRSGSDSARLVGAAAKIDYAARLLAVLPAPLRESLREPDGACAALIALLLAPADEVMEQQMRALRSAGIGALADRARAMVVHTRTLGPAFHLPVIDLALPAIKGAHEAARLELIAALDAVIHADRRVSVHEFVVLALVRDQLERKAKRQDGARKLADLQGEAATLLTLVARAGTRADAAGARQSGYEAALRVGAKEMGIAQEAIAAPGAGLTLDTAAAALDALKGLAPLQKARLVSGLFAAATADGVIRVAEAELMRLVGAVLDCPLPPLLEEIDPATLAA